MTDSGGASEVLFQDARRKDLRYQPHANMRGQLTIVGHHDAGRLLTTVLLRKEPLVANL